MSWSSRRVAITAASLATRPHTHAAASPYDLLPIVGFAGCGFGSSPTPATPPHPFGDPYVAFYVTPHKRTLTATTGKKDSNFRSTPGFVYSCAMARKSLRQELGKQQPFEAPEKEAMLNIARTSDRFQNRFGRLFRDFGLTGSQHNVLRILRGEGRPMRCDEIRRRPRRGVPAQEAH